MTPLAALLELLARVGASDGSVVLVSEHELSQWPAAAVAAMKRQRLLAKARAASSAVCPGCEEECVMPVHVLPDTKNTPSAFIVCDKRSDTGRVDVSLDRLQQWQCAAEMVCAFVATNLGLRQTDKRRPASADFLEIGMARGIKRTQMLCLRVHGHLALVVGADAMPLADVIGFENGGFTLDHAVIHQMVDAATAADPRHTPSTAKREAGKLDTQAMYQSWQKAYKALRKKSPNKSDVWYAQQIAKTAVAQGRDASTIKKNMLA